ncbi:MAG: SAM-dependent methyltransferase, partial [Trebonia sp.]
DYIDADLNRPDEILGIAREKLDFAKPVAIMLMGVLGHIGNPEADDDRIARSIVTHLKDALPDGGYLAIRESVNAPAFNAAIGQYNTSGAVPYHSRSLDQIVRFFDGLEVMAPGVVPVQQWRPDEQTAELRQEDINTWGGVAVKR